MRVNLAALAALSADPAPAPQRLPLASAIVASVASGALAWLLFYLLVRGEHQFGDAPGTKMKLRYDFYSSTGGRKHFTSLKKALDYLLTHPTPGIDYVVFYPADDMDAGEVGGYGLQISTAPNFKFDAIDQGYYPDLKLTDVTSGETYYESFLDAAYASAKQIGSFNGVRVAAGPRNHTYASGPLGGDWYAEESEVFGWDEKGITAAQVRGMVRKAIASHRSGKSEKLLSS